MPLPKSPDMLVLGDRLNLFGVEATHGDAIL